GSVGRFLQYLNGFFWEGQDSHQSFRLLSVCLSVAVDQECRVDRGTTDRLAHLGPGEAELVLGFQGEFPNFLTSQHGRVLLFMNKRFFTPRRDYPPTIKFQEMQA